MALRSEITFHISKISYVVQKCKYKGVVSLWVQLVGDGHFDSI